MTQFLILTGPEPDVSRLTDASAVPLEREHPFLLDVARRLLTRAECSRSWVLRGGEAGEPAHELCDDAMLEIAEGASLAETTLGAFLHSYLPGCERITFWYGGEPGTLTRCTDAEAFWVHVEDSLSGRGDDPWELFVSYEPPKSD